MKKLVIILLLGAGFAAAVYFFGFKNLFTYPSVKKVTMSTEDIKKEAVAASAEAEKNPARSNFAGKKWEHLADRYLRESNWNGAVDALMRSISHGNRTPRVHHDLATAYANRGNSTGSREDFKSAEEMYKKAIEINPKQSESIYGLAILYFYKLEKKTEAISLVRELSAREPKYYMSRFALGRFLYEQNEADAALEVFESLYNDLRKEPDSPVIREYIKDSSASITRIMTEIGRRK